MDVKTYLGRNVIEVMKHVKHELGDDAVILSTKTLNPTGAAKHRRIEVTATANFSPDALEREGIKDYPVAKDDIFDDFRAILRLNGVNAKLSSRLVRLYKHVAPDGSSIHLGALARILAEQFPIRPFQATIPRTVAIVGPTGIGKTTTIAKLALSQKLEDHKSIGLITTDTYRIGGAEHLYRLAAMGGIPTKVAATPQELSAAIQSFCDKDFIYIDTAGCSHSDRESLAELDSLLKCGPKIEKMLLLSASGNSLDMKNAIKSFSGLSLNSVGVTKTDETCYFGPCLNALFEAKLPIELFCTGQKIPEDFEQASAEKMVRLLVRFNH